MKKILFVLFICFSFSACDFLDIVPDDTSKLEDAFKNDATAEAFLYTCYSYQFDYFDFRSTLGLAAGTDEIVHGYHWTAQWFAGISWNSGVVSSSNPVIDLWGSFESYNSKAASMWQGIRQCYIFLNHVDEAKPTFVDPAVYEQEKAKWKGEAKFMIAYYHHVLFNLYGPIVFIEDETEGKFPRLPVEESVKKIADTYDEAIALLPPTRTQPSEYGRASQTVAKAMKAKLLLYAASPLFNGNTDYADLKDKETGENLINQTVDKERWKNAMDAAEAAITHARAQGHDLYTYPGVDPFRKDPAVKKYIEDFGSTYINLRMVLVDDWNKEIIWASVKDENDGNGIQRHGVPHGIDNRPKSETHPVGGLGPTLTAAKIFYTKNGLPPEEDPDLGYTWDAAGRMTVPAGEETCNLHLNREARFYANIGFDRGPYEYNSDSTYQLKLRNGEQHGMITKGTDHLYGGYAYKKYVHPFGKSKSDGFTPARFCYPIIRLADLYLQYAEACAEYTGTLDAKAQSYLSAVRSRAGLTMNYFEGKSGEELVKAIRRERMVELIFESQWYYDLRRWKKSLEWFEPDRGGMWGLNDEGANAGNFYQETQLNVQPLVFEKRNYLLPIKTEYVNMNEKLVQNTGY